MKKSFIFTLLVCAGLVLGSQELQAHDKHQNKHVHPAMQMLKGVELTDEQRSQIRALLKENAGNKANKEGIEKLKTAMAAQLKQPKFDEAAVRKLVSQQQLMQLEAQVGRLKTMHQIRNILTVAQKEKFDARMQNARKNREL